MLAKAIVAAAVSFVLGGGMLGAPVLAGAPGCPEAGMVVGETKISELTGGFTGDLDVDDELGISAAAIGDLDGDGVNDLAVGTTDDDGGENRGAIHVLFMNPNGTVRAHQKISSTTGGFSGLLDDGDQFGSGIASLGDLDGDDVIDLAVGSARDDDGGPNHGAVYILFMNLDGTVRAHQKISSAAGGFTGTLDIDDEFGFSVAAIGDLDGNGTTDIAVGAYLDDDGGSGTDRGAVYILFLNTNGTVRAQQKISATVGGFAGSLDNFDEFGVSVASTGDIDVDGVPDLAVGAFLDDDGGIGGNADRGAVYILFLNANGTVRAQQKISSTAGGFVGPLDDIDQFGHSVGSIGDLDADGVHDLVVGAIHDDDGGTGRGAVYVLFMNPDGTVKAERKISSALGGFAGPLHDGDLFGRSIAFLGDLDADGTPEIAVGAEHDDDGGMNHGALWILEIDGCDAPPMIVQNIAPCAVLLPATGGITNFTISATGDGAIAYQWRKDGVALVNGGPISGATSASLTLFAGVDDEGLYDCVVTSEFGSVTSAAAILGVRASCDGDADSNGSVGLSDIARVVQNWGEVCE